MVPDIILVVVRIIGDMMKMLGFLVAVSALTFSAPCFAESSAGNERKHIATIETSEVDTVLDIPLRVGGFVTTIVGTALFIGTSPITGLMTAIRPHDAIQKAADFLVVRPGNYTFVRPTGDFNYESRPYNER